VKQHLVPLKDEVARWRQDPNFAVTEAMTGSAYTLRGYIKLHEYLARKFTTKVFTVYCLFPATLCIRLISTVSFVLQFKLILLPAVVCTTLTTVMAAAQAGAVHHAVLNRVVGDDGADDRFKSSNQGYFTLAIFVFAAFDTFLMTLCKHMRLDAKAQAYRMSSARLRKLVTHLDLQLFKVS
jgi:hypothetical protein